MNDRVHVQMSGDIGVVTLNHPRTRNALSRELLLSLADTLEALRTAATCRAVVLTGADGNFCSGGDVSEMAAERPLPVGRERMVVAHRVVRLLAEMGKPVVAAVEGFAAGAGFSLAMAADTVVAAKSARFVASFAKVGLLPDLGLLWSLPQRVGQTRAKQLLMTARVVGGEEALALGLVDELCEVGQAVDRARVVAAEMAGHAPMAVALVKAACARGIGSLEDALAYEMDNQPALYLTQDHREAVAAFTQKRAPVFRGR